MWSDAVLDPALPGRGFPTTKAVQVRARGHERMKPERPFPGQDRAFLLRSAAGDRGVQIDDRRRNLAAGRGHWRGRTATPGKVRRPPQRRGPSGTNPLGRWSIDVVEAPPDRRGRCHRPKQVRLGPQGGQILDARTIVDEADRDPTGA